MSGPGGPGEASEREIFSANEQKDVPVDLPRYTALAALVMDEERVRPEGEMSLMFVSEDAMADLHDRFLGLPGPTDVLAFPMDEELVESGRQPDQGGRGPGALPEAADLPVVVGDVVICPAVAARQAGERGHAVEDEIELLVVHGVLHLLDYDHAEDDEATTMRRREQELLEKFRASRGD